MKLKIFCRCSLFRAKDLSAPLYMSNPYCQKRNMLYLPMTYRIMNYNLFSFFDCKYLYTFNNICACPSTSLFPTIMADVKRQNEAIPTPFEPLPLHVKRTHVPTVTLAAVINHTAHTTALVLPSSVSTVTEPQAGRQDNVGRVLGLRRNCLFTIYGPQKNIPLQKKKGDPPTRTKRSEREAGTHFSRVPRLSIYGPQLPLPHTSSQSGD